jgi:tetratricopeptide (TPR) repeat protein
MLTRLVKYSASLFVVLPLMAAPAYAAGTGGSNEAAECTGGKVWDKAQQKCVDPKQGKVNDDDIYETGRALAMTGRYGEAIQILALAEDKTDPRILNYLGYSHRKQGRVLVGLGYYEEALRNNPDYTLVREYMGEAHLQLGDVAAARQQLDEIGKRCGTGCAEYAELAKQIDAFEKAKG